MPPNPNSRPHRRKRHERRRPERAIVHAVESTFLALEHEHELRQRQLTMIVLEDARQHILNGGTLTQRYILDVIANRFHYTIDREQYHSLLRRARAIESKGPLTGTLPNLTSS